MKKVVNSVLASALALTVAPMVVGAEEAAQAPKMDAALEKTVKRLEALGLVAGYGNGDFGVDRTITRAEFATLVVRARGLEQGAKLAQFQSNFVDVKTSDWFAGFVNVASGQEIVKGFPDKSFKPQAQVTYAEAVAMIIRALGYEPSVKGVWPNNYIAKASELGIAKNITTPNNAATRGDVFKMLDNALRVDLMEQIEYGTDIRFNITDETLLTKYLDVTVRDMEWANDDDNSSDDLPFVTNVPVVGLGTLKANEITLDGRDAGLGSSTYKVADGINPNEFAGQHVQVWIKDGKEKTIVWMEGSEDETVILGDFDGAYLDGKTAAGDDVKGLADLKDLELEVNGKTYGLAKDKDGDLDVKVTYNYQRATSAAKLLENIQELIDNATQAKIVLDDKGDITYISAVDNGSANLTTDFKYGSDVIEKIDADKKKIENLDGGSFTALKDKEEGKDFLVFLNNQPAKLADLKAMDVYQVFYADGDDDKLLVFATRNVVEGKVDKVEIRKESDNRLKIGDKTYQFKEATYSENANKDVETLSSDQARDLDGVEVKAYLDAAGKIRHVETKDNVNDRKFKAVLTKQAVYDSAKDVWNFTVYSEKDSKVNISVEAGDIKDVDGSKLTDDEVEALFVPSNGDDLLYLEVTLDSKGEVEKVQILDTDGLEMLEGEDWEAAADEDGDTLNVIDANGKKKTYDVTDSTVVFDMTGELTDGRRVELKDVDIAKFDSIADDDDLVVYYLVEDNEVEAIFVVEGDGIESETQYGYVKSYGRSGGTDTIEVYTKVDGKFQLKEYKLDGDVEDIVGDVNRLDFIQFSVNSDNEVIIDDVVKIVEGSSTDKLADLAIDNTDEVELAEAGLERLTVARVDDVDGREITYTTDKGTYSYLTDANTVFFNDDLEVLDGVQEGDYIVLVETDDDSQRFDYVLVVADEDEVEEDKLEAKAAKFLAQSDEDEVEGPVDPDPEFDAVDNVTGSKFSIGTAVTIYQFSANLKVAQTEVESAEVQFDNGTKVAAEVKDGKVVFNYSADFNKNSATLVVTSKAGKTDEATVTFEAK